MTFDELLAKILEILPNARMDEEDDGEIVILTGLLELPDQEELEPVDIFI